jgi:hypothetical protein
LGSLKKYSSLGGRTVSIRKISNKRLSRNLKTRKIPLRVLPLAPFHKRHHLNQSTQKQDIKPSKSKQVSSPTVQCTVEKVARTTGKNVKKSSGKRPLTIKPFLSLHGTMNALRWILLLIFIYLAAGTVVVMIQDGTETLKNIVIYSIMGFFTFFMGYLGWILARDVLVIVSGKKQTRNEAEMET